MNNPLDMFFKLGDKVTGGDPMRKADWDYYMLWIMFFAFFSIFLSNLYQFFFVEQRLYYLGWSFVMLAILWFQYFGLKGAREFRKLMKTNMANLKKESKKKPLKVETKKEMMEGFKE